ncbi:MAG: phenylacetate--CoA ligase, partial [Acidimicrobiia bacterium]
VIQQGNAKGLIVHIESRNTLDEATARNAAAAAAYHIKDNIGITVDVVVESPGNVARSLGKAQRVVDRTS